MSDNTKLKGNFGNVYLIAYSADGIHSYFTVGVGQNGPYNDDDFDCEVIDGDAWKYESGCGGCIESAIEQYAKHADQGNLVWVDFDLLSKLGLEFADEIKAKFLKSPKRLVEADAKSGKDPRKIDNETMSGFCHCTICGQMVDENDSMCAHLIYTTNGTDDYAGIGNDDIKVAWYALRYMGKELAAGLVDYDGPSYGAWDRLSPPDGEGMDDESDVDEWCAHLQKEFGFCPSSQDDAMMVWRGIQLLWSINHAAREKMTDEMAKLREMVQAYPYDTAATKRPIHKDDLPITIDGMEILKSRYYGEDFIGLLSDGSKIELIGLFVDHVSMEIQEDENEY